MKVFNFFIVLAAYQTIAKLAEVEGTYFGWVVTILVFIGLVLYFGLDKFKEIVSYFRDISNDKSSK
jgi:hypothetical protein